MPTTIDSSPFPLGFLTTVPGTPVTLTANFPDFEFEYVNLILIQSHSENLGRCFFGNSRLNLLTGEGLIYTLMGAGDSFVLMNTAQNVYRLAEFRVDVEFAGDGLTCSVYVR
jgi:hypothetical protein